VLILPGPMEEVEEGTQKEDWIGQFVKICGWIYALPLMFPLF